MTLEDKIKELIEAKSGSVRAFSIESDVPYTTLRSILERGIMKANVDNVFKIAKHLNMKPEQLANLEDSSELVGDILSVSLKLNNDRTQKVYNFAEHQLEEQNYFEEHYEEYHGQTAAGVPIEGQQPIPFVGAETVSLLVNGDSMEPEFYDGDIIEYHPQPELENGEIGVFAINGGITMKKFRRNSDVRLESLNKKYEDIVIKETDDFSILGKVII